MRMDGPVDVLYATSTHMRYLCHLHHRLPLLLTHLLPTNMRTHPIHLPVHPRRDLPHCLHIRNLMLLLPQQHLLLLEITHSLRNRRFPCLFLLLWGYGGRVAIVTCGEALHCLVVEALDISLLLLLLRTRIRALLWLRLLIWILLWRSRLLKTLSRRASVGHAVSDVAVLHLGLLLPLQRCHVLVPDLMLILLSELVEVLHGRPPVWRHLRVRRATLHALLVLEVEIRLPPLLLLAYHYLIQLLRCVLWMPIHALVWHAVHYRVCCHWWTSLIHTRSCVSYHGCSMRHGRRSIHEWRSCATGWLTASLMGHCDTSRTRVSMLHS